MLHVRSFTYCYHLGKFFYYILTSSWQLFAGFPIWTGWWNCGNCQGQKTGIFKSLNLLMFETGSNLLQSEWPFVNGSHEKWSKKMSKEVVRNFVKACLHGQFLSQQTMQIFVTLKLQLQNCKWVEFFPRFVPAISQGFRTCLKLHAILARKNCF